MTLRPLALALLLAAGCGALPTRTPQPGQPDVLLHAAPDVRVLALEVQPEQGGWALAGNFALPQPVLAAHRIAVVEGLDAAGAVLFTHTVDLHMRPAPPRYREPRPAALRATLPAHAGLAQLRVTLGSSR